MTGVEREGKKKKRTELQYLIYHYNIQIQQLEGFPVMDDWKIPVIFTSKLQQGRGN